MRVTNRERCSKSGKQKSRKRAKPEFRGSVTPDQIRQLDEAPVAPRLEPWNGSRTAWKIPRSARDDIRQARAVAPSVTAGREIGTSAPPKFHEAAR